jgi:uncharacterized membrane protein YgdD (TMEM256/DUF423 family)
MFSRPFGLVQSHNPNYGYSCAAANVAMSHRTKGYLLPIFYSRKEIETGIPILYSGNIFATSFAGLVAAVAFASIGGAQGLKGWQCHCNGELDK